MPEASDPARCPLCGEPNACALAAPARGAERACWCAAQRFPAALLGRVPSAARGAACICRRCLEAHARGDAAG